MSDLSVVLFDERELRLLVVGDAPQSVSVVGISDPSRSLATLVRDERGVRLCPASDAQVLVPGYGRVVSGPLYLDDRSTTVIGIEHPEMPRHLSLYLHPCTPGMARFAKYCLERDVTFEIGRDRSCAVVYDNKAVSMRHARLSWQGGTWSVCDLASANGSFVNGKRLCPHQPLKLHAGDSIRVADLVLAVGEAFLCANKPEEVDFLVGEPVLAGRERGCVRVVGGAEAGGSQVGEPALFFPAPHISTIACKPVLEIDAPPHMRDADTQPLVVQMGPTFLMGLVGVGLACQTTGRLAEGAVFWDVFPSLMCALSLFAGSVLWPPLMRWFEKRDQRAHERVRQSLYLAYLDEIENELIKAAGKQQELLAEALPSVDTLRGRARERSAQLMDHAVGAQGFMALRLGTGVRPLDAQLTWPERRFSLRDDLLWDKLTYLRGHIPCLADVPVAHPFAAQTMTGIVGNREQVWEFVRGLVVQVCAYYSYQDVKLVLMADEGERAEWEPLLALPHLYDDARESRRLALSRGGMARVEALLDKEVRASAGATQDGERGVFYLVVCTHPLIWARSRMADVPLRLCKPPIASCIVLADSVPDLPRECSSVIDLSGDGERAACVYATRDATGSVQAFEPDIYVSREHMRTFSLDLGRLRLKDTGSGDGCPDELAFLAAYEVGNVEALDIGRRWATHDAARTLAARIGYDSQGQPLYVDLHERAQGPHALIAGTTGSGKSELIVSMVLSLCVNYAPDEVEFVIIDYKGGGLAGAFQNQRIRLPHLAGTVTNLDGEHIWRALVSLRAELERRQTVLREASEHMGEPSMDIYRYISLYRQRLLKDPLPHLIVVADEFAELRQEEPEFMDELVTAARIGRSLGVHLVLATQKPSGVVSEQIWSNARLKVSLRVADATDSQELLRRDDAAHLTRPGEFLMLVGYDEQFLKGQAAYAGFSYRPQERYIARDESVAELLDAEGEVAVSLSPKTEQSVPGISELDAVLLSIVDAAQARGVYAPPLWLDPLPETLPLDRLLASHEKAGETLGGSSADGIRKTSEALTCVLGLADDPMRQRQLRVDVDLGGVGSVALFGALGSEVERLARSMLVSLLRAHTAHTLWVYAIDLGDGLMGRLSGLPQVGGVIGVSGAEDLELLARMLDEELRRRRAMPAEDPRREEIPAIVLVITNIAALWELEPTREDWLATYLREGPRQGMYTLLTADRAGAVPYRVRSQIGVCIPTMLTDTMDYFDLVGKRGDLVPPHRPCRGTTMVDGRPLVFQGCVLGVDPAAEDAALDRMVRHGCDRTDRARRLPHLPERVTARDVQEVARSGGFPVGLSKKRAQPVMAQRGQLSCLLVLGNDRAALDAYLHEAYRALPASPYIINTEGELEEFLAGAKEVSAVRNILVVPDIMVLMDQLTARGRAALESLLVRKDASPYTFVLVSQYWRVSACYDDWLRVATLSGEGLWIGEGFADQTLLRCTRMLPEFREELASFDGFFVSAGKAEAVRVVADEGGEREGRDDGIAWEGPCARAVAGHLGDL